MMDGMSELEKVTYNHLQQISSHDSYISGFIDGDVNFENFMKDIDSVSGGFAKRSSFANDNTKRGNYTFNIYTFYYFAIFY